MADDLTQEALLRAMQRVNQLRDTSRLDAWLAKILLHRWHDHLRASRVMLDIENFADGVVAPAPSMEDGIAAAQQARTQAPWSPVGWIVDFRCRPYRNVSFEKNPALAGFS